MTVKTNGWNGIGRSLVVAVVGPEKISDQLHDPNVVVINLEGEPLELARRRALSPDLVDVVVIDTTQDKPAEWLELGHVLRARYLSALFILPNDRWGKRVFRTHLGVFRHSGRVILPELWMAVSVAAQQTWMLGWLRLDKRRDIKEVSKETNAAVSVLNTTVERKQDGLQAPLVPSGAPTPRVSRTTPWAPPAALLVELTKAYEKDR